MPKLTKKTCPVPRWASTPAQVKDATQKEGVGSGYYLARGYTPKFEEVPIDMIDRDTLMPFRQRKYAQHYLDPKGGPKHVRKLADLMRACVPIEPAHGYVCKDRRGHAKICVTDGHHRTNAAMLAKVGRVPIVVWTKPAGCVDCLGRRRKARR